MEVVGSVESTGIAGDETVTVCWSESTGGSVEADAVAEATCCLVIGARLVVLPRADDRVILLMCQKNGYAG